MLRKFTRWKKYKPFPKSFKFSIYYKRFKRLSGFGHRLYFSYSKKMLMLKKLFHWYFRIPTKRYFNRILRPIYFHKRFVFKEFLAFVQLLERNLIVLLVRSTFFKTPALAYQAFYSGQIFLNGWQVSSPVIKLTHCGDIIEWKKAFHFIDFMLTNILESRFTKNFYTALVYVGRKVWTSRVRRLSIMRVRRFITTAIAPTVRVCGRRGVRSVISLAKRSQLVRFQRFGAIILPSTRVVRAQKQISKSTFKKKNKKYAI